MSEVIRTLQPSKRGHNLLIIILLILGNHSIYKSIKRKINQNKMDTTKLIKNKNEKCEIFHHDSLSEITIACIKNIFKPKQR